ncbi:unnamed protein product [Rhizopus stolonifer]
MSAENRINVTCLPSRSCPLKRHVVVPDKEELEEKIEQQQATMQNQIQKAPQITLYTTSEAASSHQQVDIWFLP